MLNQTKIINNKQALGYCRVSTEDQAEDGLSLDYQEQQCRKHASRDGYDQIIIIRDEGKSGTSIGKRKGIQKVIELAEKKEVSIVYVLDSSRLARNTFDHALIRNTLRENNVDLKYLNGQSSADDPNSKVADGMFAVINQYHSDITREKTKQAIDAKAQAGYFPTHAPTGYINCLNPDKNCDKVARKIIAPNPKTAHLVTEAFKLYATGQYNVYQLNDLMYEKGLVTTKNKKLSPSMFYAMLKNKIYLGEIHWQDIHVKEGKHIPLIDQATFDKAQSTLSDKGGNRCRRRKHLWLLNGYIFCPIHECRYTAEWHLNKSRAYYHCKNRHGCGKYIEKYKLEDLVAEKFKNLEFDTEFINLVINKVKEIFEERNNEYAQKHRGILNQQNAWKAKLKVAEERLLDQTIKNEDYSRINKEGNEAIEKLDKQFSSLKNTKGINIDIVSEILHFTKDIYNTYRGSEEKLQKQFLNLFFDGFDVKDGIIIKDRYSPLFKELIGLNAIIYKTANSEKPLEIKAESEGIIRPLMGDYWELNPD